MLQARDTSVLTFFLCLIKLVLEEAMELATAEHLLHEYKVVFFIA